VLVEVVNNCNCLWTIRIRIIVWNACVCARTHIATANNNTRVRERHWPMCGNFVCAATTVLTDIDESIDVALVVPPEWVRVCKRTCTRLLLTFGCTRQPPSQPRMAQRLRSSHTCLGVPIEAAFKKVNEQVVTSILYTLSVRARSRVFSP
jgi:hypothetical protein